MNKRIQAICDLSVPSAREFVGLHEYDGRVQDLSLEGVRAGLARLGGPPLDDSLDEANATAHERALAVALGELEMHRRNPLLHLDALDLSCYDREYAPDEQRAEARRRHLASWPEAIAVAIATLDRVSAAVADALLPAVRGLPVGLEPTDPLAERALAAHARLVEHVERCALHGDPDPALGRANLERLLGAKEATPVDLGRLEERADAERDRLRALLADACDRLAGARPLAEVVDELARDHPSAAGVLEEAKAVTTEAIAFTREHELVPDLDGECLVGPAPPSRRWALAMMSWAAPYEDDAPSRYYITPPDPAWPAEEQEQWLQVFSRSSLPAITVHEVAPGHFAHGRCLRRVSGDARRTLQSEAFAEGWAHYVEELCLEEGFRAGDPRFAVGVAVEALQRVTRLAVSIGLHSGTMSVDEAIARFAADAFIQGSAARAEATRATFDPTYGRYTWGKLEILALRDRARAAWGAGYSHRGFHAALLRLGSPPLGLIGHALDGGTTVALNSA
ncbi:MAG TPA: DUF885 family protein [Actinomycetes bacterium]|jgi:hypothetical protein|nr:DUF885 family protein [Actinomycetes bacterium]